MDATAKIEPDLLEVSYKRGHTVSMAVTRSATLNRRLERSTGTLATAATGRMEETLPWFRAMSADDRAWVGLVAQAGIAAFVAWHRAPGGPAAVTADVFGTAPRELARAITLAQTVDLVRTTIEVVEENLTAVASGAELDELRESVLRYSREIAFAAAEVYARAAEERGAWDARLESATLDALLSPTPESPLVVSGWAATLGWHDADGVVVIVGSAPTASDPGAAALDERVRRTAQAHRLDVLSGVRGDLLIVVLGGVGSGDGRVGIDAAGRWLSPHFGGGAVVLGPLVACLEDAGVSATEALDALAVAAAWPDAPRPVAAHELLPERALAGQSAARDRLVRDTAGRLAEVDPVLVQTLSTYLERAGSLEATARALVVHTNTVRYRMRRVADVTGFTPADPRDAFALRLGLALSRLAD